MYVEKCGAVLEIQIAEVFFYPLQLCYKGTNGLMNPL